MKISEPILSFKNVSFKYEEHLPVLSDISFEIQKDSFIAIVGPSGSGKSTVLRLAVGLEKPTLGSIENIAKTRMVFQNGALFPWRTALQNVLLGLTGLRMSARTAMKSAQSALALVGITSFAKVYPRDLSGGQRQRVGIARALVSEPSLLLLDEPFAALDVETTEHLIQELLRIKEEKKITICMISHSIEDAVLLADEIFVCAEGNIKNKISISLPHPRHRRDDSVQKLVHEIRIAIPGFQS